MEWNLASDPEYSLHSRLGAVDAMGGVTIAPPTKRSAAVSWVRGPGETRRGPGLAAAPRSSETPAIT